MNFARDFVGRLPGDRRALVVHDAAGRSEWAFGPLVEAAGFVAARLEEHGVRRGDVVMTLLGSGMDWPLTVLACLRIGAVVLPCSEQLRPKDVALRLATARPALIVADARNREALISADCPVVYTPVARTPTDPPAYADMDQLDPSFVIFTSGTTGTPKLVRHGQRFLWGQRVQTEHWLAPRPGELAWSTAAPGWSKSARNSFIAPWLGGAAALLQDGRFDPAERLAMIRSERVDVLCMSPTEYRLIAAHVPIEDVPSLRRLVTAGEAPGAKVVDDWFERTGLRIADGYGQTETGHLVSVRPGEVAPRGSMGRPLPGIDAWLEDGELVVDPGTVPTFFLGYAGERAPEGPWHTGDLMEQDGEGFLFFRSRADDVIISAGYRIGPGEVEEVLVTHPAVRLCAVIGTPDADRGEVVTAVVVLNTGFTASDGLARELQEHVKAETAPYKYPRVVRFVDALPMTSTGKISRAALR